MSLLGFNALGRLALGQINSAGNAQATVTQAAGTGVARAAVAAVAKGITQAAGIGTSGAILASPAKLFVGAAGIGTAGSISGLGTTGVTGASGTGVARTAVAQAEKPVAGAAGVGTAGIIAVRYVTFSGVAGTGQAGTVFTGTPVFFAGTAGIGLAGAISTTVLGGGFSGAASIGIAGAIVAGLSGGGTSKQLIEDRPRDKRRKPGLEPVAKRFDPPAPIEIPKLPLPPFSDEPAIAPAITEPGELRELVPAGLLSLQDQIFNAQDTADIGSFLRGIDQDDQDAADIADVLALLDD